MMENYLKANHNRPIKILIINLHSSRNAGDAALALTAIQQLRKNFPNNQITLSMNDPSSHHGEESIVGSFMYWFQSDYGEGVFKPKFVTIFQLGLGSLITVTLFRFFNREIMLFVTKEQKTFLKAYLEADMIVSAPGNFLYSSGKFGFALITALFSMAFAIFAKKPLYLLPQSIGPFRYAWERHFVKWVLSQARIIMVREPVSMAQLISFGVKHPRLYQFSDLAFLFKGAC